MEETIIKVEGMMCTGCENRIQNAVSEIKGVESVKADHEKGIVEVKGTADIKEVKEAIEDIGFEVKE
mgnify:CR=1 FL=1